MLFCRAELQERSSDVRPEKAAGPGCSTGRMMKSAVIR